MKDRSFTLPILNKVRWTIGLKLAAGFGILLILVAITAITAYVNLNTVDEQIDHLLNFSDISRAFDDAELGFFIAFEGEADYLATQSDEALTEMIEGQRFWTEALDRLDALPLDAEELQFRQQLEPLLEQSAAAFAQLRAYVDDGDLQSAQSYHRQEIESITDDVVVLFDEGIRPDLAQNRLDVHAAATQAVRAGVTSVFGAGAVALLIGFGSASVIGRGISNPIRDLTSAAQNAAQGNLDVDIAVNTRDEVGALAQSFNTMVGNLRQTLQTLQDRGQELEARSEQLVANQRAVRVVFAASEQSDPQILLRLAVNLIRDQFDLYHVQIYLVDDDQESAVLRESTGYAGLQLLQRKHKIPLDQPSLVTKAINENEPVLVADVSQDPNFLANPLLPDTKSELVVPLRIGEGANGALDIQSREVGTFTEDMISLFETMTDQVALLFQNSELFARTAQQTEELSRFANQLRTAAEVSERLSSILDPEQLLDEVVQLMQSRFGFYHAHIYLLDEAEENLVVASGSGEVGEILKSRGHSIPLNREHSLVARAARNRTTILVNDTSLDSDFLPNPLLPNTRAEVAVALVTSGRLLGVLDIQDDQANRFSPSEINTFNTLAGQVATALDNAQLFERQQQTEQAIRELARQNELVLNSAAEGIFGVNQEGKTVFVNPAAEQMLGYSAEELLGDVHHHLIHHHRADGSEYPADECKVYAAYRDGETHEGEDEIYWRKDGTSFPVSYTSTPLVDEEGKILGAVVTFRDITEQLESRAQLEKRAAELQTVAEVSTSAATALDPQELLRSVVELTKANFDLYHAHIYLIDEDSDTLELAAGAGEAGAHMVAQGWSIPADSETSLVARAFRTKEGVIENDVQAAPDFLPNPLLPDTAAEMAIPMLVGDRVLGVLDVQADYVGRFTEQDVAIKTTLAEQVATALDNARLFDTQRQQTAILENSRDFIAMTDMEANLIYVNPAGARLLGYDSPEDFLGKKIADSHNAEGLRIVEEVGIPAAMQQGVWQGENELLRTDGMLIPVEQTIFVIRDENDAPRYLATIMTDITERKRTEKEIRQRAAELQTVAEVSTSASGNLETETLLQSVVDLTKSRFDLYHAHIYLIDETDDTLKLAAGAGEPGAQMVAQGWSIPADSETSLVARAFRTKEGVIENDVQAAPDFLPNPLLPDTAAEMAIPIIVGDQVLGVLDVQSERVGRFTEQDVAVKTTLARQVATALDNARLFEETQGVADRLREVDRLKSEFLANMSHELRTPLNSILGYTQLLLLDLEDSIPEESYQDLSSIDTNGKHLLNLINDILDLAKIEAGRLVLNKEFVEVDLLLDQVATSNAGLFLDKSVDLVVEVEDDLPPLWADNIRMIQVLNNLISNAAKFTEEGAVTLQAFSEGKDVCISVIDEGIGISEEDLDKIFERFQQVDGSFTRRAEGTGLGLPITQHLVHMHGGQLDVSSVLGAGSTFTMRFPISAMQPPAEEIAEDMELVQAD